MKTNIVKWLSGLLFVSGVFTIAACNPTVTPTSEDTSIDPTSESTSPSSSEEDLSTIDFPEEDYVSRGTADGFLIDISANQLLSEGNEYICYFTPSTTNNPAIDVQSTNEDVLKVIPGNSAGEFKITTYKPGDALIKIYDVDDILVYRYIARVRKAFTEKEITKEMYENDIYKGLKMAGNHRLTVLSYQEDSFTFQVRGQDDYEYVDLGATGVYKQYYQEIDSYEFELTVTDNPNSSQTRLTYLYITRTGDCAKLYYQNGLLNILYAAQYEYLHQGLLA